MDASSAPSLPPEVPAPSTSSCWQCGGAGYRLKKKTADDKSATAADDTIDLAVLATGGAANAKNLKRVACPQCKGAGHIVPAKRKRPGAAERQAKHTDWNPPGPVPYPGPIAEGSDLCVREGVEHLSFLTGHWRIFQEIEAHRYSTDDVVTAWVAWRASRLMAASGALRTLDIGCGIGSVLLMTAWLQPHARCVGVEAQLPRASNAWRSTRYNGQEGRVAVLHGDLRATDLFVKQEDSGDCGYKAGPGVTRLGASASTTSSASGDVEADVALPAVPPFDIITGTPPYFDLSPAAAKARAKPAIIDPLSTKETVPLVSGEGIGGPALPGSENSARCLFEYRGGIEAYAVAASRWLAPRGLFVVVESSQGLQRGYDAAKLAGFRVVARLDCVPKAGKPPLFNVFVMCRSEAPYYAEGQEEHLRKAAAEAEAEAGTAASAGAGVASALVEPSPAVPAFADGEKGAGERIIVTKSIFQVEGRSPYEEAVTASSSLSSSSAGVVAKAAPEEAVALSVAAEARSSSPKANPVETGKNGKPKQQPKPFPGSLQGELVVSVMVRGEDNERTAEYISLLKDMGKPG